MAEISNFTFPSGNLNLTLGNNTLGILEFDMTKSNISLIGPEIDTFFNAQSFSYRQPCAYAISGQYGFLPRLLYYLLLTISLLLRNHDWLSAGALTGAMTYSASACVHAFALLLRYDYNAYPDSGLALDQPPSYYGDADLVGIFPIIVAGCIMLTPILNWSTMIRKHHAQAVVLYWGFLMFFALIFTLPPTVRSVQPYIVGKLATCVIDPRLGCTYENVIGDDTLVISVDFYQRCRCNDTCGAVSLSDAPFRQNTNLQAFLLKRSVLELLLKPSFNRIRAFSLVFLSFILWQGVQGMIAIQWGQREARNWIFRSLGGRTPYSVRRTFMSKSRYHIGKTVAAAFYLFAILVTGFSPFLFVCSIVVNEILVWSYPVAESYDAVGQWSIWVIAGFISSAAVIQRYNAIWVKSAKHLYSTTIRLIKWTFGKGPFRALPLPENRNKTHRTPEIVTVFLKQCGRPFQHMGASIADFGDRVLDEWQDFKRWGADPVAVSNQHLQQQQQQQQQHQHPNKSGYDDQRDGLFRRETGESDMSPDTEMSSYQVVEREPHGPFPRTASTKWDSYSPVLVERPQVRN